MTYSRTFPRPALPGPARLPDPLRPITDRQAKRLFALACYEGAFKPSTFRRMLRYYGFFSAERVRAGVYDRLCELALDPIAAKVFALDELLPGERPWLRDEEDEGAFLRAWALRTASDDFLLRQVELFTRSYVAPPSTEAGRFETALSMAAAARELRFRAEAVAAMLRALADDEVCASASAALPKTVPPADALAHHAI